MSIWLLDNIMVGPSSRSSQQQEGQQQQHFFLYHHRYNSHHHRCMYPTSAAALSVFIYIGALLPLLRTEKDSWQKLFEERQWLAELQITLLLRTKKDNRIHAAASLAHHEKSFVQKGGNDRAKCTHIPNICWRYAFDSLVLFWRSGMLVNVFSDLGFHHCCLDSEMQK